MAMTFSFRIHPFGYNAGPIEFGAMSVHSSFDRHEYTIRYKTKDGWKMIQGQVSKLRPDGVLRSGHRNFLHLLQDILNDADLDSLGENYVHMLKDIQEAFDDPNLRVSDYKEDK